MSPDLQMRVLLEHLDWNRAEQIARTTQIEGAIPVETGPRRFLFWAEPPTLVCWAIHDHLSDASGWDTDTWEFDVDARPLIVRTFEILFDQIPEDFAVEVMWVGDKAEEERAVTRAHMLDIARQGTFGGTVRYCIQAATTDRENRTQ